MYFSVGSYHDYADFHVMPMQACSLLLGRPWEFDLEAAHHGRSNKYSFMYNGNNIVLLPLTPAEIVKFEKEHHASISNNMIADVKKKGLALLAMHYDLAIIPAQDVPCYTLSSSVCFVVPNLLQAIGDGMELRATLIQGGEDDASIARMELRTTPNQEGEDDEDITTSDTSTLKSEWVPSSQGEKEGSRASSPENLNPLLLHLVSIYSIPSPNSSSIPPSSSHGR